MDSYRMDSQLIFTWIYAQHKDSEWIRKGSGISARVRTEYGFKVDLRIASNTYSGLLQNGSVHGLIHGL